MTDVADSSAARVRPSGWCECGCGEKTTVPTETNRSTGRIKGVPLRFVRGHNNRLREPDMGYAVEDRGHDTPCHIWQGAKTRNGYGVFRQNNVQVYAHRRAYELAHGPSGDGRHVDHLCFQRDCVNGEHLEQVTPAENNRRAARRNSERGAGEAHLVDEAFAAVLAEDFGIPETDVRDALLGEPKTQAIAVCGWAEEPGKAPIKKGEALTGWAKKHKAGRYAKARGPEGGAVRVPKRTRREKFTGEQILANLERMGG